MKKVSIILGAALLAASILCFGESPKKNADTFTQNQKKAEKRDVRPLPTSSPRKQGVDPDKLKSAYHQAETLPPLLSLLVLRNGMIVGESYLHGAEPESAFNIKSVSKSILSALTGIAIREGFIKNLDQPISDFFPEFFKPPVREFEGWARLRSNSDKFKRSVTVRHLLTHTTGYVWVENGTLFRAWLWSSDYVRFFLDLPFAAEPGKKFIYNTGGTHALSALLARASGMSTRDFGNQYLFEPIGMKIRRWDRAPEGNYIGGAEMHFTARDMARFGLLYLNGGQWYGEQVLPDTWVKESTDERIKANYDTPGNVEIPESWVWSYLKPGKFTGYGYLWWRRETVEYETFVGLGYGGQFIFVIPKLKLVVVTTSSWDPKTNPERFVHYAAVFDLVDNYILPSVER